MIAPGLLAAAALWSSPQPAGPPHFGPSVLLLPRDGAAAVGWSSNREGAFDLLANRATDGTFGPGRAVRRFDMAVARSRSGVAFLRSEGLRLSLGDASGPTGPARRLARVRNLTSGPLLVAGPRDRLAVAWREPSRRTRGSNDHDVRAVLVDARGRTGRPVTVGRAIAHVGEAGSGFATGFAPDGGLAVAYERKEQRGYGLYLRERRPSGRLAAQRRLGAWAGSTSAELAAGPGGRLAVAWSSEDGGEERSQPLVFRVAMRRSGAGQLRSRTLETLPPGGIFASYPHQVALATATDGSTTVAWSGQRTTGAAREFPLRARTIAPDGTPGPVQAVAPSALVGQAVATRAGVVLTWTTSRLDLETDGNLEPRRVEAAVRAPGAETFGPAEPVSDPATDTGLSATAVDPLTGAPVVLLDTGADDRVQASVARRSPSTRRRASRSPRRR